MEGKLILAVLGVVCVAIARGGDAGAPMAERPPAGAPAPEVVLQLQYARGALDRIYLAQFRQAGGPRPPPGSVPATTQLCADLCHAGLGGEACGATCADMMPVGLATALRGEHRSADRYGEPRVRVCPTLCANRLGAPLCNCSTEQHLEEPRVDWDAVCHVFCCSGDGYVLGGCPPCEKITIPPVPAALGAVRLLDTVEGWAAWCSAQCRQGHGGAACNCDRAPFQ